MSEFEAEPALSGEQMIDGQALANDMAAEDPVEADEDEEKKSTAGDDSGIADAATDGCALAGCEAFDGGCSFGDGCDGCDPGCNLIFFTRLLPRLSTLLLVVALVAPASGLNGLFRAPIRLYRRHLTHLTPRCPSSPSCSEYALSAIDRLGARRGLAEAAARIRGCGRR